MEVRQLDAPFGAAIHGVDLSKPLDDATRAAVNKAFVDNVVVVFKDQKFDKPDDFVFAASQLGEPMPPVVATYRLPGYEVVEELISTATDKRTGEKKLLMRGGSWHTDHSNLEQPPKATTLYALELPSKGGNTEFTNMYLAYEALPDDIKEKIRGKRAFQAYQSRRAPRELLKRSDEERKGSDGTWQPLVRRHPDTGRDALYLNPMRCDAVEGMSEEEGDALLDALYDHYDQPQFQYSHAWSMGDMLIWDNRSALHQATSNFAPSERRYMHRIMLKGEKPIMAG
ncbi:MAG: TauD/TfdA family dioxygenase [Acetobacterales bacterium]